MLLRSTLRARKLTKNQHVRERIKECVDRESPTPLHTLLFQTVSFSHLHKSFHASVEEGRSQLSQLKQTVCVFRQNSLCLSPKMTCRSQSEQLGGAMSNCEAMIVHGVMTQLKAQFLNRLDFTKMNTSLIC